MTGTLQGKRLPARQTAPNTAERRGPLRRLFDGPTPWLIPSILVLIAVSIYPLIFAVVNSFRFYNLGVSPEPRGFIGFDHYADALTSESFMRALGQTLVFCTTVTAVETVLGVLLALLLREKLVGTSLARALFIMPVAIAPTVAGLAFRSMYANNTGLIPNLLGLVGIDVPREGILGSPSTAFTAVMITDIWQWTPFVALIVLAAMQGVPEDVVEAARLDGAGSVRILWFVTLPLISAALVTVALLRFIQSFNVFDIIYVETRGGPAGSTSTIGMEIFFAGLNNYNIGYASALTMLASIIVGIFVNVYFIASNRKSNPANA